MNIEDIRPDLGGSTKEPNLRNVLMFWYTQEFDIQTSEAYTRDYIKELKERMGL